MLGCRINYAWVAWVSLDSAPNESPIKGGHVKSQIFILEKRAKLIF